MFKTADKLNEKTDTEEAADRLEKLRDIHDFVIEPRLEDAKDALRDSRLYYKGIWV